MDKRIGLDRLCINTIRTLSIDAVQNANSGHPGMPMGMAPAAYVLWTGFLKHNPKNPLWINRDRFVLSAGHGSILLYSLLHLSGYDLPMEEIKNFRRWGSRTPGHPEYGLTPGVEVTTGPLGQGISNAVGMAIAEKYLAAYFNRQRFPVIDYRVYVIAGDGCLQEGISYEACSLAGHLGLNNLIVMYDDNRITIDGKTSLSCSEDVTKRYDSHGWSVISVSGGGNDLVRIRQAIARARREHHRPTLIVLKTHIGFGSPHKQDSADAHGDPLGEEEISATKKALGWNAKQKFFVPEEVTTLFQGVIDKGIKEELRWNKLLERYYEEFPSLAKEFNQAIRKGLPDGWAKIWEEMTTISNGVSLMATREAQGKILDKIMSKWPFVMGGSADLTKLNNTSFSGATDFSKGNRLGRYIRYGIREHAMGAIMNGIAVNGMLIPYGGTFLCFSDYMRPALRLAALSAYPSIFVFTHDSIGVGENGPTHQPVEHLASLRSIPNLTVLRPADVHETIFAWKFALENRTGPTVIVLTRQGVPILDQTKCYPASNLEKGAYVLKSPSKPRAILIGSGSEVHLALEAHRQLMTYGLQTQVVSMPSWELFERQPKEYKEKVLPAELTARVAIEAGVKMGWERYIGVNGAFVGMSRFGASAPSHELFERFGITVSVIVEKVKQLLEDQHLH